MMPPGIYSAHPWRVQEDDDDDDDDDGDENEDDGNDDDQRTWHVEQDNGGRADHLIAGTRPHHHSGTRYPEQSS